jgi:outer membrane protein TolC
VGIAALLAGASWVASTSTPSVDVEALVREAVEAHPGLDAARRSARAAGLRAETTGAFPDPIFSIGANNVPLDPFGFDVTPMTGVQLGLRQRIPWPEKLALERDASRSRSKAEAAAAAEAANRLGAEVRRAYYRIHLFDITEQVLAEDEKLLTSLAQSADARYRVGKGHQQDILHVQVALRRVENRSRRARRLRSQVERRLNQLLARTAPQPIPALVDVPISQLDATIDAARLVEFSERHRPILDQVEHLTRAIGADRRRARKSARPDFEVGFAYTVRADSGIDPVDGADFVSVQLGVGIPVQSLALRKPRMDAARNEHESLDARLAAERLRIREIVDRALTELPILEEEMRTLRAEIIPTTEQALAATRASLRVDAATFTDVLEVEADLVREFLAFHELHVEHELLVVDLAEAIGVAPTVFARPSRASHFHRVKR